MDAYVTLRGQLPISSTHCLFLVVLVVSWAEDRPALLSSSLFWCDGSFLICLQSLQMILQGHLELQEKSFPLADLCCWKFPFLAIIATLSSVYVSEGVFGSGLSALQDCAWNQLTSSFSAYLRLCSSLTASCSSTTCHTKLGTECFSCLHFLGSWQLCLLMRLSPKLWKNKNSPTTFFSVRELRHYFILARMLLCPGSASEII